MTEEGARVAVVDVDGDRADGRRRRRSTASATRPTSRTTTRSRPRSTTPPQKLGGLSLLFNNAGTSTMHRSPRVAARRVEPASSRINLTGVFHGFRAVHPPPARQRRRPGRQHRVDQRHPARGRRGAVLGGQGRGHRAHRERRARVRADGPRQRDLTRDDPHHAHRAAVRRLPRARGAVRRRHARRPGRRARGHRRRRACSSARTSPASSPARTSSIDGGLTLHGSGVDGVIDRVETLMIARPTCE